MSSTCEVCSLESPKYRCPTCGLMSCSLACTQSHKIYCAPKAPSPKSPDDSNHDQQPSKSVNGHGAEDDAVRPPAVGSSAQLTELLDRYPSLREELREIYKTTLEEEWVEPPQFAGRGRGFGQRGRGGGAHRNRGPWTREKGFNRGLGKVRKLRERCDDGSEIGQKAEGFVRFMTLVIGEDQAPSGEGV
ncbi:putative HIT finger domain protein [Aspergillus campestris IBT 28561]|uniref:HIT finger domain protein n=1 Tax=Aspergillus campestris (strain IBT 28561) TaxID=1392248 RepID=A0A2I1D3C0_ASPC2|nr:putative HIT finger domain protein [Aspergillus campestris IBT 28561]PKY04364.1 putative HIT finger domain protein [Aspergillus campestris IBT 28561]